MCVCVREREIVGVGERERERLYVCVWKIERGGDLPICKEST